MGQLSDSNSNNEILMIPHPSLNLHYKTVLMVCFSEVCWKNETEKLTALWSVRCSRVGGCNIAMNTENKACSLVHWREFLPPPFTLSRLQSLMHKEGTVRPLFITKQSLHCNLGGVQLRKLLASAEACFH